MRPLHRRLLAAILLTAGTAGAATPEVGPAERWIDWENNFSLTVQAAARCDMNPALATQFDQSLLQLGQRLARTALAWPGSDWHGSMSGFNAAATATVPACRAQPLTGYVTFSAWAPGVLEKRPGKALLQRPAVHGAGHAAAATLYVHVNQFHGTTELDWLKESPGPRLSIGQPTGTLRGLPVWGEKWALVAAPGRPAPFVPAPLERVVKAWVAARKAELDKTLGAVKAAESAGDKAAAAMFTRLADELRARTERTRKLLDGPPAQLQGPVWVNPPEEVAAQPAPYGQQVWMDNPAYFDARLPRSAVQLLAIDIGGLKLDEPAPPATDGRGMARQLFERADWAALAQGLGR